MVSPMLEIKKNIYKIKKHETLSSNVPVFDNSSANRWSFVIIQTEFALHWFPDGFNFFIRASAKRGSTEGRTREWETRDRRVLQGRQSGPLQRIGARRMFREC